MDATPPQCENGTLRHLSIQYVGEYVVEDKRPHKIPHGYGELINDKQVDGLGRRDRNIVQFYKGEWQNGSPYGKGSLKLLDNTLYEGEWNWEICVPWHELLTFNCWKLLCGHGSKTLPDGSCCEGEWCEGQLHGQSTETWFDGTTYRGNWRNGKQYEGTLTLPDGTRYQGEWRDGREGASIGELDYVGPPEPDGMRDPARYRIFTRPPYDQYSTSRYDDVYRARDYRNLLGRGTLTLANGVHSEGEWREGQLHGKGTQSWTDGERYEGEFRYGKAWRGRLTLTDGSCVDFRYGFPVHNDLAGPENVEG